MGIYDNTPETSSPLYQAHGFVAGIRLMGYGLQKTIIFLFEFLYFSIIVLDFTVFFFCASIWHTHRGFISCCRFLVTTAYIFTISFGT